MLATWAPTDRASKNLNLQTLKRLNPDRAPITSVEWCPTEASMLATTGADGQLCVWDLALERDPEEELDLSAAGNAEAPQDLPPQLLFVHGGQSDMKEVRRHHLFH